MVFNIHSSVLFFMKKAMYFKRFANLTQFFMCTFCEVLVSVHVRKNCFGTKALTVLLLKVSKFNTSSSLDPD